MQKEGISRLSSAQRKLILMPDDIKDVLIGILLGDAHIVKRSYTGNSRLVYAQTAIAHKAYFYYVYSFLLLFVLIIINHYIESVEIKELIKNIVLYLLLLCNFLVLMYLESCFIYLISKLFRTMFTSY